MEKGWSVRLHDSVTNRQYDFFGESLIGRKFAEIKDEIGTLPFSVVEEKTGLLQSSARLKGKPKLSCPSRFPP